MIVKKMASRVDAKVQRSKQSRATKVVDRIQGQNAERTVAPSSCALQRFP